MFHLTLGHWIFQPRWSVSLGTGLLFILFVSLGYWQIGRATEKSHQEVKLSESNQQKRLTTSQLDNPLNDIRYQEVQLTGQLINHKTLLLDNQIVDKKVGYRVLTPLQVSNLPKLILIDRGFVQSTGSRQELPDIPMITSKITVTGIVHQIATGIVLKKDLIPKEKNWPQVIQSLDYQHIKALLEQSTYQFVIKPTVEVPSLVLKAIAIQWGLSPQKHLSYAFQWFSMALLTVIYYLIVSCRKENIDG